MLDMGQISDLNFPLNGRMVTTSREDLGKRLNPISAKPIHKGTYRLLSTVF